MIITRELVRLVLAFWFFGAVVPFTAYFLFNGLIDLIGGINYMRKNKDK